MILCTQSKRFWPRTAESPLSERERSLRQRWILRRSISQKVQSGQILTLDYLAGTVTVEETGETYPCDQLGEQALKILEAGGIKPLMRARFGKK